MSKTKSTTHPITQKLQVHDSIFINFTRSICPECRITIDAEILVRDNKVYMKKRCPNHGWFEALIFSDYEMYRDFERYNKPGDIPLEFQTEVKKGCPDDCGLCPSHKQHTCLAIIEITEMCNMKCPTCFASSAPSKGLHHKNVDELREMIKTLERSEGEPAVVMVSGGEPTVHPDFLQIIQNITDSKVKKIIINSNGLLFASRPELVAKLSAINESITVYLQFDGFNPETNKLIRGEDGLLEKKLQAIENLKAFNVGINLVMTVQKGVNDHEIGDVVNFVHDTEGIAGLTFQPFFAEGRFDNYDPMDHTTMSDVIHAISSQTKNMYTKDDFYPIPCPYPHCSAATFSYKDPVSDEFVTISRLIEVEDYLDYFRNTLFPDLDKDVLDALESIFSFSSISGSHEMIEGFCNACGIEMNFNEISDTLGHYLKNVKMITIKPFMNSWDFDVRRIMKCCVHQIAPDNKLIPFCAYNTIYRKNYQSSKMLISLDIIE